MRAASSSIRDLLAAPGDHLGTDVSVRGWVRTRRDSRAGLSFIALHDGSSFDPLQLVCPDTLPNYTEQVLHLTAGCAIVAQGRLVSSQGKNQSVEVHVEQLQLIGGVEDPESYPIAPKRHTLEYLRTQAHLRPRTNVIGAISRVRSTLAHAIHDYFHREGFCWINTPILTASDCEGAGELFRVSTLDLQHLPHTENGDIDFGRDFFGQEAFLTVSGQLNVESYCLALSKVYTFGPTFRAENSNTSRHLAEFWMIEPEIAFAGLDECATLAEGLLRDVLTRLLEARSDDMAFFARHIDEGCIQRVESIIEAPLERIRYDEAIDILLRSKRAFEFPIERGMDLQSEHERYLVEEYLGRPLIVTDYPAAIKSFYMRLNDDGRTVAAMDVLVPGIGEIIGGSQREERLDVLQQRMTDCGIDPQRYGWYLDLRRYGSVPHAGFGLGFERLLGYVSGVSNVRDLIPFPRTPGHVDF